MPALLIRPAGLALIAVLLYTITFTGLFLRSQQAMADVLGPKKPVVIDNSYVYWSFRTNEINKLINDLKEQREALQAREDRLAMDTARAEAERKELERLMQDIETRRKELSEYLIEVKRDEVKNLKSEVDIYANMAPGSVVAIFKEKSDEDVIKILSLMKPDTIGPIMEQMMKLEGEGGPPSGRRAARLLDQLQRLKQPAQ